MEIRKFAGKEFIVATVCVVENENGEFLMIKHKRGPFIGKKNCPSGKKNEGQTFIDSSIEETKDETGIVPINPRVIGTAYFENAGDLPNFFVEYHKTEEFDGDIVEENDECFSFWQDKKNLPYDEMHKSDKQVYDMILKGERFDVYSEDGKITNLAEMDDIEHERILPQEVKQNPFSAAAIMASRAFKGRL